MDNSIVFDFFSDPKATAIAKLSNYLHIPQSAIERALEDGCSTASFINELKLDLLEYDSDEVSIVGRHVTTSTKEDILSFYRNGLLDLRLSLLEDTPLSRFLSKHNVQIDVDNRCFHYNGRTILIEGNKRFDHVCFRGRERGCSWSFGCDAFQKLSVLNTKLYELGATLEFFVSGTLDEMLNYSTVSRYPEILDTIDQLISKIKNSYSQPASSLCCEWMSQDTNCYVIEFNCLLSNMETYNPISYLNAYNEIKGCFNWSNITYEDYYNRRVPQRAYDNRYLFSEIINVYIYGDGEQYASLQPGLFVAPVDLKIYRVNENELIPL